MNNFNPDALAMIGPDFEESFSQGETKVDIEPRTVSAVVSTYVSTVWGSVRKMRISHVKSIFSADTNGLQTF